NATVSPDVVISQVYGGGGNAGATLTHDFIELFNRGTYAVVLTGWSLQYASATGAFSTTASLSTDLSGSIPPGGYLLVQESQGAGGTTPLPPPEIADPTPIAMSATTGKVRLLNGAQMVDLIGYGSTATQFEGSGPALTLSNTTAALRLDHGCQDTDNNAADFVSGAPNPRNSSVPRA